MLLCYSRLRNLCMLIYADHMGPWAACRSQASVCTARCQYHDGGSSMLVYRYMQYVVETCFKLVSSGMIISKAGCLSQGCKPVPYHLVIAWIKVQALAQSCSSCVPVPHCHVSHSQPKNTHSQTAMAMHAHYLLAARPNLQQFTGELEL